MQGYHEGNPLLGFAYHNPVLLREVVEGLNVKSGNWYLDCTLGDGGYSVAILKAGGKVVGIDVDPQALERARNRLQGAGYSEQIDFILIQSNFRDIDNLIAQTPIESGQTETKFNGVVFDLGVSSLQLEDPIRGFSFQKEGPLDMRMDPTLGVQALDLVNNLQERQLYELFKDLGEEKYSKRLANSLVIARAVKPFSTTIELAGFIEKTIGRQGKIPASRRRANASRGGHPATRVFQALRIAVNDELGALQSGLDKVLDLIEKNGHILVVSFHSLEDRIVKHNFREWVEMGFGEIVTKKPYVPTEDEVTKNPRSRSAKLRIFKKTV